VLSGATIDPAIDLSRVNEIPSGQPLECGHRRKASATMLGMQLKDRGGEAG
jgi:hypothetical protein